MSQKMNEKIDYDQEVEIIDKAIVAHHIEIEDLKCMRYELIARKKDLDMHEIIECLYESGLEPQAIMELLVTAVAAVKDKADSHANITA